MFIIYIFRRTKKVQVMAPVLCQCTSTVSAGQTNQKPFRNFGSVLPVATGSVCPSLSQHNLDLHATSPLAVL